MGAVAACGSVSDTHKCCPARGWGAPPVSAPHSSITSSAALRHAFRMAGDTAPRAAGSRAQEQGAAQRARTAHPHHHAADAGEGRGAQSHPPPAPGARPPSRRGMASTQPPCAAVPCVTALARSRETSAHVTSDGGRAWRTGGRGCSRCLRRHAHPTTGAPGPATAGASQPATPWRSEHLHESRVSPAIFCDALLAVAAFGLPRTARQAEFIPHGSL